MPKITLSFILPFFACLANSQYVYKGQVFSVQREETVSGEVYLKTDKYPSNRRRGSKLLARTDAEGKFSFTLQDTTNVNVFFSSLLGGDKEHRLFYEDSINCIFIDSMNCTGRWDLNDETALNDIANGDIKLLCYLGYATYHFSARDSIFQRTYNLRYQTMADEPQYEDCAWLYNKTVAAYLDSRYGEEWRKHVRLDVPLPSLTSSPNPIYKTIPGLQQVDSIQWIHLENGYYKSITRFYTEGFRFNKSGTFSIRSSGCSDESIEEAGYWYIRSNSDLVLQYPTHTRHFNILKFDNFIYLIEQGERVKFIRDMDTELKQERFMNKGTELKEIDERYTSQFLIGWHLLSKYYGYEL